MSLFVERYESRKSKKECQARLNCPRLIDSRMTLWKFYTWILFHNIIKHLKIKQSTINILYILVYNFLDLEIPVGDPYILIYIDIQRCSIETINSGKNRAIGSKKTELKQQHVGTTKEYDDRS
jgi:hypothetical protein